MGRRCEDLAERVWPDDLQEVQDNLTRSAGIPVLFVHPAGRPLAACEDLTEFCREFTRAVALSRPCLGCGRSGGQNELSPDAPLRPVAVHLCPLGLVDVSIPIRSVGEDLGYLVTAQAQSDNPDISASWQGAFAPGDQEFAAFAGKLSRRSHLELENAAACLSAVAWLTGTLAAARRRNSSLATHIREQRRWLQQHVTTDPVTGVANRRRFCAALEAEVLRARRYKRSLAVAVLDIEGFRGINDEFGHGTGDAVLRSVADCLSSTIRQTDLVGRVGGDEFGVLFPETTRSEAMIALARVGNGIIDLNASGELPVEVRVSVGAVDITQETDDMLGAAIKAEEQARSLGGYVG